MRSYKTLYIHIPFCRQVCHYCDFAKTANFNGQVVTRYFQQLRRYIELAVEHGYFAKLDSIFIGGGTPSLFSSEYEAIFKLLEPHIDAETEITLESNPLDVTEEKVKAWKSLGVNRLSIGVQSFDQEGLSYLTREHSPAQALKAIEIARRIIDYLNVDLIYGWKNQTNQSWEKDLSTVVDMNLPHISCYSLTYEPGTVLGRKVQRGVLNPSNDEKYSKLYNSAKSILKDYQHEEISNWSLSGYHCRHNWSYWSGGHYLAFGLGAHGYLFSERFGRRYSFTKLLKRFLDDRPELFFDKNPEMISCQFEDTNAKNWLIEQIVSSFRTIEGCNLNNLQEVSELEFKPNTIINRGLKEGAVKEENGYLRLANEEWIREHSWCHAFIDCFHPRSYQ